MIKNLICLLSLIKKPSHNIRKPYAISSCERVFYILYCPLVMQF
nr:MAG TPA: hypothetical protein [Caudoviricetes sp.]